MFTGEHVGRLEASSMSYDNGLTVQMGTLLGRTTSEDFSAQDLSCKPVHRETKMIIPLTMY